MENDNEEIIYEIGNVYLTISSEQIGKGYLTLTNRGVHWKNNENDDMRSFRYVDILTHAISKNENGASIFTQIQENEDDYHYVFFSPEDSSQIQSLFDAFSHGSSLCPGPEQEEITPTINVYEEDEEDGNNNDDDIWEDDMNIDE